MASSAVQEPPFGEESPLMTNDACASASASASASAGYSQDASRTIATSISDEANSIDDEEMQGMLQCGTSSSVCTDQKESSGHPQERPLGRLVVFHEDHAANEESPLLKNNTSSSTNYSQRTARTVGTSGSDEMRSGDHEEQMEFLGSVVVFKTEENCPPPLQAEVVDASLIEDVVEEVYDVAEAILEELHDADEGDTHFLEIGLTRNSSILPGDIADAAAVQPPFEPPPPEDHRGDDMEKGYLPNKTETKESATPLSAYVLLLGAVVALSSIAPLLQLQHDASGTLKVVWRMLGTSIFLLPFAIMDIYRHGFPQLTIPQWVTFYLSTFCYAVLCIGFVLALDYTAVGNVVILSNSLALILLVGKLFVGDPVSFLEGSGAIIAFSGAALCSRDSAEANGSAVGGGYFGDALAILSALGGVGYLICAKTSRAHIPLYLFMFLTMFVGSLMILVFEILVLGESVTFDRHPNHGLWGWVLLDSDRLPLEIAIIIVCNGLGTMGYVRAMQYFDTLLISSAALAEPVVAELMAVACGVGSLPGFQGWMGNLLVAVGTFAVIFEDGSRKKDRKSLH
jgi:drug/metabolite transporter (DMT)-like permease